MTGSITKEKKTSIITGSTVLIFTIVCHPTECGPIIPLMVMSGFLIVQDTDGSLILMASGYGQTTAGRGFLVLNGAGYLFITAGGDGMPI